MKSRGRALFIAGFVPVIIALVWGRAGYYTSSVPVMLFLFGAGIAMMVIGSRMNKGSEPNKAVSWTPSRADSNESAESPSAIPQADSALIVPIESVTYSPVSVTIEDATPVSWSLLGSDGRRYPLARTTVIGRNPSGADLAGADGVIALVDADSSVSNAHAVITIHGNEIRVRDLASTNGTFVVDAGGVEVECSSIIDTPLGIDSTLELGEYSLRLKPTTSSCDAESGVA